MPSRFHTNNSSPAVFHSFLTDDIKQDDWDTFAQTKCIIYLLKESKIIFEDISTILENAYSCAEKYICAT